MTAGLDARMARISRDGKIVNVPMDHGITMGAADGLRDIESTVDAVTRGGADCVLTQKGLAPRVHPNKNNKGYVIHLNASTTIGPDVNDKRPTGTVENALRAGADAVSVHVNVGSDHEPEQIEHLAAVTDTAHRYGLPVLAMTYARGPGVDEHDAASLGHAVRLGEELGADVLKTAYSGDAGSFESVVGSTAVPVIMAGGPPGTDREMLGNVRGAIDAGAAGVSMGRSIFQHEDPEAMTRAVASVVHEGCSPDEAVAVGSLTGR
jgi:fructose-bisphosphate aldolase/2-amino-3,7-dideoxy-D-threo-hept-6-ulosonate synthase